MWISSEHDGMARFDMWITLWGEYFSKFTKMPNYFLYSQNVFFMSLNTTGSTKPVTLYDVHYSSYQNLSCFKFLFQLFENTHNIFTIQEGFLRY